MEELIGFAIKNLPNFAGFALFALAFYKVFNRQLDILQKVIEDCLQRDRGEDKDTDK